MKDWKRPLLISLAIIFGLAFILYLQGRLPICKCGYVSLWAEGANTSENSQMIADWYTFSHIIHGFVFFFLLRRFAKKFSPGTQLVFAVLIEAAWEFIENQSFLIDRYRNTTVSLDYYGDSILNSTMDILFMILGYIMAMRLPVWIILLLAVAMEVIVGYIIRDNLTLNVLMLLYPSETILEWQQGL